MKLQIVTLDKLDSIIEVADTNSASDVIPESS